METFERTLSGSGLIQSGFLSRATIIADKANLVNGEWREVNSEKVREVLWKIRSECLVRTTLPEDEDATALRREFMAEMDRWDRRYAARLPHHFAVDLYTRAIFSPEGRITTQVVERAIAWTRHQYLTRQVYWPSDVSKDKTEQMTHNLRNVYRRYPDGLTHAQAKRLATLLSI